MKPNKGGQRSAAGEGRAQTRENIVQSQMHPTPTNGYTLADDFRTRAKS
jgi:hypothetical protein